MALGYHCLLVSSDAFSEEKLAHMRALGAELQIVRSDNKRITAEPVKTMIEASRQLSLKPHQFWADQFNNADAFATVPPVGVACTLANLHS